MRDPKSPEGSQQPSVEPEASRLPLGPGSSEEIKALEEQLESPFPRESEADLSALDDEEIRREAKREVVRGRRSRRKAEQAADERERKTHSMEKWVRIVLLGLLVHTAAVATAVVVVGVCQGNAGIARIGMAPLCAVGGLGIYRLPLLLSKR